MIDMGNTRDKEIAIYYKQNKIINEFSSVCKTVNLFFKKILPNKQKQNKKKNKTKQNNWLRKDY